MGSFQFFDIILFALIAAFLILRLRNTLGRRDGHEGGYRDPFSGLSDDPSESKQKSKAPAGGKDNVIALPQQKAEPVHHHPWDDEEDAAEPVADTPLGHALAQIAAADRAFTPAGFVSGARIAFEMVLNAFASGNVKALKSLLSDDVFRDFAAAVRARADAGHVLEETLVGIKSAEIVEAELENRTAQVTVKFVTEQVSALRDSAGDVIEGNPSEVIAVTDFWTFARDVRSRDPNWTLVATRSPN